MTPIEVFRATTTLIYCGEEVERLSKGLRLWSTESELRASLRGIIDRADEIKDLAKKLLAQSVENC